ncbi:hypothetical protein Tco_1534472, partial [Tanacetum coccineum]
DEQSVGWARKKENTDIRKSNAKNQFYYSIRRSMLRIQWICIRCINLLNEYAVLDKKVGYVVSNGSGHAISGY